MSQRITAGMASLAALACCAMFVLMWQTQAANRALVQESQALNARLLEQMQALAEGLRPAGEGEKAPSEWNRLRLKCVADREDGPPLAGVRVRLVSASENTRGIPPTELISGNDGLIDFGQVLYGQYMVDCTAPNGMALQKSVSIRPGQDLEETLVCPAGAAPALVAVRPELTGEPAPAELRDRVWYRFELGRRKFDADHWSRPRPDGKTSPEVVNWFVAPDGRMIAVGPTSDAQITIEGSADAVSDGTEPVVPTPAGPLGGITYARWTLPADLEPVETLAVEAGSYTLGVASICVVDENDPTGRTLLQLINPDGRQRGDRRFDEQRGVKLLAVWGRQNELSMPVRTEAFRMAKLAIDDYPEREASLFRFATGGPWVNSASRESVIPTVGSKVAFFMSSDEESRGLLRSRVDRLASAVLRGVVVLSYHRVEPQETPFPFLDLAVLLSSSEVEALRPYSDRLSFALDEPDAARTELSATNLKSFEASLAEKADDARARNYFEALDADKDGLVSLEEFQRSRRLRSMFELKGVGIDQPVTIEEFQRRYMQAIKDQESSE